MANSIWEDTSEELVIEQTLENVDYLISSTTFREGGSYEIENYLQNDSLIQRFDTSISTNIVYNKGDKLDNYTYFPFEGQDDPNDPVRVIPTLLYDLRSMERIANVLEIEGEIPTKSNELMLSSVAVLQLEEIYNISISPGYSFNISIAQRFPVTDKGETQLRDFQLIDFENIVITGIYRYNGAVSMTRTAFNQEIFTGSAIFPITDDTITQDVIQTMDGNSLYRIFMIIVKTQELLNVGIDGVENLLSTIANKIKSRFWHSINDVESDALQNLEVEFNFSFNASYLYYPLIILSLLLTHYAIGLLVGGREDQLDILRTRGANDLNITILFMYEFLIVVTAALLLGTPLAILFSLFIPSLGPGGIDIGRVVEFYNALALNYSEIYELSLLMIGFLLFSFSYQIFRTIFYPRFDFKLDLFTVTRYIITILISGLFFFQIREITNLDLFNQNNFIPEGLNTLPEAIITLSVMWLLFSQVLSDMVVKLLQIFSRTYFSSQKNKGISFYLQKTFNRKNLKSKVLVFYLIFIFSLLVFASSLYTTYDVFEEEAENYLQGSDYRIHTEATGVDFRSQLEAIEGIGKTTGVYQANVYVGSLQFTVYGVNPDSYLDIGFWDYADSPEQAKESVRTILDKEQPNAVVSEFLLDRLDFEIYQEINIIGLAGAYNSVFNISATIVSAPGLGLANMQNPELNQPTTGWMIVNLDYLMENFNLDDVTVFLASNNGERPTEQVQDDLENTNKVVVVNPVPINQNFIGVFISEYLPNPQVLLFFILFAVGIIGLIMISMTTDYILFERKQEFALMIAIGGTREKVARFIYYETSLMLITSLLIGIIYGIVLTQVSLLFYIPFTLRRLFVPLTFGINIWLLSTICLVFIFLIFLIVRRSIKLAMPDNITDILLRS